MPSHLVCSSSSTVWECAHVFKSSAEISELYVFHVVLCCVVFCYAAMSCYTMLYCVMLCYVTLCHVMILCVRTHICVLYVYVVCACTCICIFDVYMNAHDII